MYQKANKAIRVLADFYEGSIYPRKFKWDGKTYSVKMVHLNHQEREGSSINYIFAAETEGGVYKIAFNNETLAWTLKEYYLE